jgi:FHA domain
VIDLGSVHGTFVANERLTKDSPVELEVGQSLRFAASSRTYVLQKNNAALFPATPAPSELNLPSPPDPDDLDSVVAYNTILNRYILHAVVLYKPIFSVVHIITFIFFFYSSYLENRCPAVQIMPIRS